jgi:hypothetical protein
MLIGVHHGEYWAISNEETQIGALRYPLASVCVGAQTRLEAGVRSAVWVTRCVQRCGHPFCQRGPDILSNRMRAPAIFAAGIDLGALEYIAGARLRSIDEGDGPAMDSPTSGDLTHDGYKNRPASAGRVPKRGRRWGS